MKLSDLDTAKPIILKEGNSFVDLLSEGGVGKIVQGVNTTGAIHIICCSHNLFNAIK